MANKSDKTISSLPSMEHTFHISVVGEDTKQMYKGDFTYRKPTLGDRAKSQVMRTRLDGDLENLDPNIQAFHSMVSILRHTLVKSPSWWIESDYGYELHDLNVVSEVYKETLRFEKEWADKVYGKDEEDKKDKSA